MTYRMPFYLLMITLQLGLFGCADAADQSARPNIVIIVADDLGWGDVGFNGSREINTPNLDRLAAEGTRFTSLYAMQFCTPARAALMTGRYPMRYGLQTFAITPGQGFFKAQAIEHTRWANGTSDMGAANIGRTTEDLSTFRAQPWERLITTPRSDLASLTGSEMAIGWTMTNI